MEHGSSLLLGLAGVAVERVERVGAGVRVVHVVTVDEQAAACPSCGGVLHLGQGSRVDLAEGPALRAGSTPGPVAQAAVALPGAAVRAGELHRVDQ